MVLSALSALSALSTLSGNDSAHALYVLLEIIVEVAMEDSFFPRLQEAILCVALSLFGLLAAAAVKVDNCCC